MDAAQILERAKDIVSIKRVFGEPIERDGVLVIPVAVVYGGGGGGIGAANGEDGGGGGFGVHARAVGVYVIKNGDVRFEPAIDITPIVLGVLTLLGLLARRRTRRTRRR